MPYGLDRPRANQLPPAPGNADPGHPLRVAVGLRLGPVSRPRIHCPCSFSPPRFSSVMTISNTRPVRNPRYSEKRCDNCGASFLPRGARQRYCEQQACIDDRLVKKRAMASGADRIGDSEGAKERHASGKENAAAEAKREAEALHGVRKIAEKALDRAQQDPVCGEQQFLERIKAVGGAKRAQDWAGLQGALVDIAACCLSWAARIDHAEGESPMPPARITALSEPETNGNGHQSVPERYADILLEAAKSDLDGETARTTIERLIGVGL